MSKNYRCGKQLSKQLSIVSINNGLKQIQSNFIICFWKVQEMLKILFSAWSITDHSILIIYSETNFITYSYPLHTLSQYILLLVLYSYSFYTLTHYILFPSYTHFLSYHDEIIYTSYETRSLLVLGHAMRGESDSENEKRASACEHFSAKSTAGFLPLAFIISLKESGDSYFRPFQSTAQHRGPSRASMGTHGNRS